MASDTNNHELAQSIHLKLEKMTNDLSESDRVSHLVCAFMYFVKTEKLSDAQMALESMKKHRKFMLSENFIFMKRLLQFLTHNTAIYSYEREFKTVEYLFHQLKVIESLQGQDTESAKQYWQKLQQFSPAQYLENFSFMGEKCLFSLCLDKLKRPIQKKSIQIKATKKIDRAYEVLSKQDAPIRSELLFELIWDNPPETKNDLSRLAKLISKTREQFNLDIGYKKGSYFLTDKTKTKVSNG